MQALAALVAAVLVVPAAAAQPPADTPAAYEPIGYQESVAVGKPNRGRLVRGVKLPFEGPDWFTWHPIRKVVPNAWWRRWGHDRAIRTLVQVLAEHRAANPGAPRVGIGDLSLPRGGHFGRRYGGIGHRSHQNGLDIDVYYPRLDRVARRPWSVRQIDRRLAQDLVNRFVAAGAQYVFVGPRTGLRGPRQAVQPLIHHDDHLHVRFRALPGGR